MSEELRGIRAVLRLFQRHRRRHDARRAARPRRARGGGARRARQAAASRGYRLTRERVRRGALVGTKIHVLVGEGEQSSTPTPSRASLDRDSRARSRSAPLARRRTTTTRTTATSRRCSQAHLGGDVLRARAGHLRSHRRRRGAPARRHRRGGRLPRGRRHRLDRRHRRRRGRARLAARRRASRSRRVPLGGGIVDTAHGRLPVPAPATLELLAGAEVEAGGDTELTTPTGAGILAASVGGYGVMPPMRVLGVGWGAGDRELDDRPNLLRVVAGVRRRASPTPPTTRSPSSRPTSTT